MRVAMIAFAIATIAATVHLAWPTRRPSPGEVPVVIYRSTTTYGVSGSTAPEIRKSLGYYGPAGHWGITRYEIRWPATFEEARGACQARDPSVRVRIKIKTPVLSWTSKTPSCLKAEFEAMAAALAEHEDGHARIAIDGAEALGRSLSQIAEERDCATMAARWERAGRQAMASIAARQAAYDAETSHGVKTGVSLKDCAQ